MRRFVIILGGLVALASGPVLAADSSSQESSEQSVPLSPVALPIVIDGRVANYVFVTVKIWLTPNADVFALRDKEPYFRDALVRAAHRTPFVLKGDFNRIDEARLKAALQREATAIAGPGAVWGVQVVSQTPQHWMAKSR